MSILDPPILLKILAVLGLILGVNALVKNLAVAALVGAAGLAWWFHHPWLPADQSPGILLLSWQALVASDNLLLALTTWVSLVLSALMAEAGMMRDLVTAVRRRLSPRTSLAVLPAMIGWLPMPGGAAVSAPLVASVDADQRLDPQLKTLINYWFRHIWEYWWPLYPAVILAIQISGLSNGVFILLMLPVSLISVLAGWLCFLRRVPAGLTASGTAFPAATVSGSRHHPLILVSPILCVIAVWAVLDLTVPALGKACRFGPMLLGLVLALLLLQCLRPQSGMTWRKVLSDRSAYWLMAIVLAIQIFGAVIATPLPGGLTVSEIARNDLAGWGVPTVVVVASVAFISGLATGIANAFIGASLPVAVGLVQGAPTPVILATVALAYGAGYIGILVSPVHVCMIVTNRHFKTQLGPSLWRLLPACLVLAGFIAGYCWAIQQWG